MFDFYLKIKELFGFFTRQKLSVKLSVMTLVLILLTLPFINSKQVNHTFFQHADQLTNNDYLIGAWYFSSWHTPLILPQYGCDLNASIVSDPILKSLTTDPFAYVKTGRNRELDYLYSTGGSDAINAANLGYVKGYDPEFYLLKNQNAAVLPLYRWSSSKGHSYTNSLSNATYWQSQGYKNDGSLGYLYSPDLPQPTGTVPLYRVEVYNSIYELTTDKGRLDWALRYALTAQNWSQIKLLGYVDTSYKVDESMITSYIAYLPNQSQPEEPLLGYSQDSDLNPEVMNKYINWASDNGINFFAFDWYWGKNIMVKDSHGQIYSCGNQREFFQEGLRTFLSSSNSYKMKFALSWFPVAWTQDYTISEQDAKDALTYLINNYITYPNYLKINGKPVVYIAGNGDPNIKLANNVTEFKDLTDYAQQEAQKKGLPGIYFVSVDAVQMGIGELAASGFSAVTQYSNTLQLSSPSPDLESTYHVTPFKPGQPGSLLKGSTLGSSESYQTMISDLKNVWEYSYSLLNRNSSDKNINFIPTVSGGWDNSDQVTALYAGMVLTNRTPTLFKRHLIDAKNVLDIYNHNQPKILMINSWNEWGEGSMIEPDKQYGTQFIEQVKSVFGLPIQPMADYVSISGKVVDSKGQGIANAPFIIGTGSSSQPVIVVYTNASGFYQVDNYVKKGDYYDIRPASVTNIKCDIFFEPNLCQGTYITRDNHTSYENQHAGSSNDCAVNCNFTYQLSLFKNPIAFPTLTVIPMPTQTVSTSNQSSTANFYSVGGKVSANDKGRLLSSKILIKDLTTNQSQVVTVNQDGGYVVNNLVKVGDLYSVSPAFRAAPNYYPNQVAGGANNMLDCGIKCNFFML